LTAHGKKCFETQSAKIEAIHGYIQEHYGAEKIQQLMRLLEDLTKIKTMGQD